MPLKRCYHPHFSINDLTDPRHAAHRASPDRVMFSISTPPLRASPLRFARSTSRSVKVNAFAPGYKVRVKSSVVVYHVPKSKGAATELQGMVGVVDSRADEHEGKKTSATMPCKVALPNPNGGKDFIAHVEEAELEEA